MVSWYKSTKLRRNGLGRAVHKHTVLAKLNSLYLLQIFKHIQMIVDILYTELGKNRRNWYMWSGGRAVETRLALNKPKDMAATGGAVTELRYSHVFPPTGIRRPLTSLIFYTFSHYHLLHNVETRGEFGRSWLAEGWHVSDKCFAVPWTEVIADTACNPLNFPRQQDSYLL